MKKSVIIYDSWGTLISNLPDEKAGGLIKMILAYAFEGVTVSGDDDAINAMFAMIRKKMDDDIEAYEEVVRQRSEAGKKGMAKRWGNKSITDNNKVITNDNKVNQAITNITVSVSDSVSVSDKDKKKKDKIHNFQERKYDYADLEAEVRNVSKD